MTRDSSLRAAVDALVNRQRAERDEIDCAAIYAYGEENYDALEGYLPMHELELASPDPIVNWDGAPERNPEDRNTVNWGVSMWRHKLDAMRRALTEAPQVIWLDWDVHQIADLPPDFWSRLADGPPFGACLRYYKRPQTWWRPRGQQKAVPHGAWVYVRQEALDGILKAHEEHTPKSTDEIAYARWLDEVHGGWIGVDRYRELGYDPGFYDQRVEWRMAYPAPEKPLFKNFGRY